MLGTLGGGGSILSVPILVYLFSLDAVMASAYSLFIVGTTSLVGCILNYRSDMINVRVGSVFGIPSLVVIFITRKLIVPSLPEAIFSIGDFQLTKQGMILGLFSMFMIIASLALIQKRKNESQTDHPYHIGYLIITGSIVGFLTGLVGAGGGFIIVPALVYLTNLPFKTAVGTTLMIITINSLMGFAGDVLSHSVNWNFLIMITGLAVLGIIIANRAIKKIPAHFLRPTFGWFILIVGTCILVNEMFL